MPSTSAAHHRVQGALHCRAIGCQRGRAVARAGRHRVPWRGHPRRHQGAARIRGELRHRLPRLADFAPDGCAGRRPAHPERPRPLLPTPPHPSPPSRPPPPPGARPTRPPGGVPGGALIIVGEDYGEGSSIMQERTHAFAMKSQMWLLDPRPHLPSIVQAVHDGFALSEATHTPVMLELRIRSCHLHGSFITRENRRPAFTLKDALENPRRDIDRIVLPPASFLHEREKLEQRWPAAVKFITERKLNEWVEGVLEHIGIVTLGGLANSVLRALKLLGQADLFGASRVPLYILNVAYPLIEDEVDRFCRGKRAVLMVEEGQPDYLEQNLNTLLRRRGLDTAVHGKDLLPRGGDYTVAALQKGIQGFLQRHHPAAFAAPVALSLAARKGAVDDGVPRAPVSAAAALAPLLPPRPPGLCVGCPERPIFSSLKLVERELGMHHVSADIGCHLFSIMPPFHLGATTMGYGLGGSSASAFAAGAQLGASKPALAFMGDGGFWHNGLTSGIANAVFNKQRNVFVIVDNNY